MAARRSHNPKIMSSILTGRMYQSRDARRGPSAEREREREREKERKRERERERDRGRERESEREREREGEKREREREKERERERVVCIKNSSSAACISRESNPGHIDGNDVFYH